MKTYKHKDGRILEVSHPAQIDCMKAEKGWTEVIEQPEIEQPETEQSKKTK